MRSRHDHRKKSSLTSQRKKFDWLLLIIPLFLFIFGVLMIFEASNVSAFRDFGDKYHYVKEQLIWGTVGFTGLIIASLYDYRKYYLISVPAIVITILALLVVFIPGIGVRALGAHRWIGFGSYSFQPAEFAKLTLIFYLSAWFSYKEKGRLLPFLLIIGLVAGLVVLEPDLGTAIIIVCTAVILYFASGAPLMHFIFLLPTGVGTILLLALTSPYRFRRLTSFLDPEVDPLGMSYHIRQVLLSLGSGGIFGMGLGGSRQKYEYLPEATTDSIFAIIGEEFGFLGATLFIFVLLFFLFRLASVAKHAPDTFGKLLAIGIFGMISTQMIINLGAMTATFPLTGVPLPLISYGGSNLIVTLFSLGILINIQKQSNRVDL